MWGGWVDVNCPTVPPTGSGIQVQLPPSLYKASHVRSVKLQTSTHGKLFTAFETTLRLLVNSIQHIWMCIINSLHHSTS